MVNLGRVCDRIASSLLECMTGLIFVIMVMFYLLFMWISYGKLLICPSIQNCIIGNLPKLALLRCHIDILQQTCDVQVAHTNLQHHKHHFSFSLHFAMLWCFGQTT